MKYEIELLYISTIYLLVQILLGSLMKGARILIFLIVSTQVLMTCYADDPKKDPSLRVKEPEVILESAGEERPETFSVPESIAFQSPVIKNAVLKRIIMIFLMNKKITILQVLFLINAGISLTMRGSHDEVQVVQQAPNPPTANQNASRDSTVASTQGSETKINLAIILGVSLLVGVAVIANYYSRDKQNQSLLPDLQCLDPQSNYNITGKCYSVTTQNCGSLCPLRVSSQVQCNTNPSMQLPELLANISTLINPVCSQNSAFTYCLEEKDCSTSIQPECINDHFAGQAHYLKQICTTNNTVKLDHLRNLKLSKKKSILFKLSNTNKKYKNNQNNNKRNK